MHDDSIENITYEVTFKTTGVTENRHIGLFAQKFFTNGKPGEIKATDANDEPDFNGAFHLQLQPDVNGYHYLQVKLGDAAGTYYLFKGTKSGSMKFDANKWYQLTVTVEKDTTTHKAYVTVYNRDMETGYMVKETKELPYCTNPYLDEVHPLLFGRVYRAANYYGTATEPHFDPCTFLRDIVIGNAKIYNKSLSLDEINENYSYYIVNSEHYGFTPIVKNASPNEVFRLDYSDFNSENHKAVTDATGKSSSVTVKGNLGLETDTAIGKQYLKIASGRWNDTAIVVDNPEIRNLDEMSVEVWAKILYDYGKNTGRLVCFGDEGTSTRYFDVMPYEKDLHYRPALDKDANQLNMNVTSSLVTCSDKWTHYVFTRKWNAESSTWVFNTYVNGKKEPKLSGELPGVKSDESTAKLFIGNNSKREDALVGGIGGLTVYDKALSQTEVDSKYIESMSEYVNNGDIAFDVVKFDNGIEKIDSLEGQMVVNANISAANNSEKDEDAVIIMAIYAKNNALKKLEMKPVTIKARKNTKETISFTGIMPEDGDTVRVFVWEDFKTMKPMIGDEQKISY